MLVKLVVTSTHMVTGIKPKNFTDIVKEIALVNTELVKGGS